MSEQEDNKTFELDGTRPIESGEINVVDTFQEDGVRPIAESPDFLVNKNPSTVDDRPTSSDSLDAEQVVEIDGKRPVDKSEVKVVDTFEDDGERPIMSNKYEVVDTFQAGGERPISSE
ncbi:hypothetical protein [Pleurocapsa sp. PCC 7319]|uniref:hypothetical protein n=1 Tax=Pleurocapsa sp. PCC 7319 TaxID=118161 RepID=UPI00034A2422|nr:hypothetical protein [Pleurocapsa sp. PCC 7319]